MENLVIAVLAWSIIVIFIFKVTPIDKIKAMGDFFKKVLPSLPLTDIFKSLKK